jgi:RNA polymerase sigma-70 factor (ECF subfamily)
MGDLDAWASFVQRHNQLVFRVARSIVKDDAEAEDIVQETYIRAYMHLADFRGPQGLRAWLARIATNEALMRLRRNRRVAHLEDVDQASFADPDANRTRDSASPEASLMRGQVTELIEAAVDALPEEFRPVFMLRNIQQLSTRETAECLGVPESTVKTRLHRANKLVRENIGEQLDMGQPGAFEFGGQRCARVAERVLARIKVLRSRP